MTDPLDHYEHGPDATVRATIAAMERLGAASGVVLVEGVSDQVAVEAAARRLGRDLDAHGLVVLPIGGAHAVGRVVAALGDRRPSLGIAGLCDAREERWFAAALDPAAVFVCVADLEDELVRAAGRDLVEHVVAASGDEQAFTTMRSQPAWRDRPFEAQFRRFVSAGARRKLRYASALVAAIEPDRLPRPLTGAAGVDP